MLINFLFSYHECNNLLKDKQKIRWCMMKRNNDHLSSLRVNSQTDYFYEILCDLFNIKRITSNINKTLRIYRFLGFYLC